MPLRPARVLAVAAVAALLAACGFQLRGTGGTNVPDDWRSMYLVTSNPNGELAREVRTIFAASGVDWADDRKAANYQLVLGPERFSKRNLSISADARAAEFEFTMLTEFTVRDATGAEVMPATTASVNQQMENDPRNVVGKEEELRIIKSEMRTELAHQLLRRVGFFAASTASR
jgi:LPS-assembly lipoprotein